MGFFDILKSNTDTLLGSVQSALTTPQPQPVAAPPASPAPPAPAQAQPDRTQPEFNPISGVSLDLYANLLAEMSDCGQDEARCLAIAEAQGVSATDWEAAKEGWTARMADAALQNRVSIAFLDVYGKAMDKKRGGKEPISLETYIKIFVATSFGKNPNDPAQPVDREAILRTYNLTLDDWNQCLIYWSPKVSDPNNPVFQKYCSLLDQEIKRL